ncbi:MAG: pyruvate:ferredoxin (flavodoxin) oxidoreductase [Oscillospiraceae bacterium]|jgi:pyruvate-ferredoxin/flavodoxin oxidoreductase|nr:pyruvate:ferredoxin (flavodoxin) oxidoreductase [Oscillospiraceae bacterium]
MIPKNFEKNYLKYGTMDANEAVAYVSYAFIDVAIVYPITPSSGMAENIEKFSVSKRKNIFGNRVAVRWMQSEAGVAGTMHGALTSGALATTYTASQGLLLMIPNMYKMAGELLPAVIHVASRTISTHALSIFGDHSDIYACRQIGFSMLCSNNPQESADMAIVAHLSAIESRVPFMHFFDGFRTSHEIQKIRLPDYKDLKNMLDSELLAKFRKRGLTPKNPVLRGSAQNDDIYFQIREACNKYYKNLPFVVLKYLKIINKKYKTDYKLFEFFGDKNAENIIVAMGSVCETCEEVIDYLKKSGKKIGVLKVRLFRPFVSEAFLKTIPKSVKKISVLDRTKEPGSVGEPLYLDVTATLVNKKIKVFRGRYGLSSKDTTPSDILSVFKNMDLEQPKEEFTIGINDDVTNLSLPVIEEINTSPKGTVSCKLWGLGSDGTISTSKNSIKIIGNETPFFVQGYFAYDSKKSGGLTIAHLRFGPNPIKSTYYVKNADFVACHNMSYIYKYDLLKDLNPGGKFLLNCSFEQKDLEKKLPENFKRNIFNKQVKFYIIDAVKISKDIGLEDKVGIVLQAAFFKILNFLDIQKVKEYMKKAATKTYIKKGKNIVSMNHEAIEIGIKKVKKVEILNAWSEIKTQKEKITYSKNDTNSLSCLNFTKNNMFLLGYVENILKIINKYEGNSLPVSKFLPYVDGTFPQGSAAFEKRSTATQIPEWKPENCIQCNLCSLVCPHAVIRPVLLNEEDLKIKPLSMKVKNALIFQNLKFSVVISAKDCTGCGCCVSVCPGFAKKGKALIMKKDFNKTLIQENFNFSLTLEQKLEEIQKKVSRFSPKGSQFYPPLLEFSGACAGCGQTPYAKLCTQLFGENMIIANATGCSSIWGGSSPSTPYTYNKNGHGPAWHNSLLEDNAEFGFGIMLGRDSVKKTLIQNIKTIYKNEENKEIKAACKYFFKVADNLQQKKATKFLLKILESKKKNSSVKTLDLIKNVLKNKSYLFKKSIWIFGGDGWAYDIGFGGLDHIIASNANVNVLIFDTEIYSNTGGQASKATPLASSAIFELTGKETVKKDLAAIFMTYGNAYIAQVALTADYTQCVKAFKEAESFDGPSVIIAYSPCINHGITKGMNSMQEEEKIAVKSGYWNLFRFDPRRSEQEKNPLMLDSRPPSFALEEFLKGENRYKVSEKLSPEKYKKLINKAKKCAAKKYESLAKRTLDPPQN